MLGAALRSVRVDYLFTNLNQVVVILAYLCIVGIGGYKVSTGALSISCFSITAVRSHSRRRTARLPSGRPA